MSSNGIALFLEIISQLPYGLAVRIPGFHPGGPGSTPGMGTTTCFCFNFAIFFFKNSRFRGNGRILRQPFKQNLIKGHDGERKGIMKYRAGKNAFVSVLERGPPCLVPRSRYFVTVNPFRVRWSERKSEILGAT